MRRPHIKICCISSVEEARLASGAGAHLLGLVGPMPSGPGVLTLDAARAIAAHDHRPARPILLTASDTAADIARDAATVGVSSVQVVRHIAVQEARTLGESGLDYVQVIHVEGPDSVDLVDTYAEHCSAFLLDSGRPAAGFLGGTGAVHDWSLSAGFVRRSPRPVWLAGGLTPENVGAAIETVRPDGLDICSGLRREGRLDAGLLRDYIVAIDRATEKPA